MWGMAERQTRRPGAGEARFAAYLEAIAAVLGDVRRAASARAYCTGLLLPGERKSVEPMAARIEPGRVQARHQSMHHVVAKAEWDDAALLRAVREQVLPAIERHGPAARASGTGRCATGWSTTRASPSRASTRWGWRGSTAASSASRRTARWRSACRWPDRKSTRLNSSHANISYAVFCLKKKKNDSSTTMKKCVGS